MRRTLILPAILALFLALPVARAETAPAAPATAATPVLEPAAQPETYPLERCPITGNPLGSMGEPIALNVEGLTVQVCCAHCDAAVHERIGEIRKAITKALVKRDAASYPFTVCVACGKELPRKPIDMVFGSTLVRVDGSACAAGLGYHGAEWALKVRQARAAATPK